MLFGVIYADEGGGSSFPSQARGLGHGQIHAPEHGERYTYVDAHVEARNPRDADRKVDDVIG